MRLSIVKQRRCIHQDGSTAPGDLGAMKGDEIYVVLLVRTKQLQPTADPCDSSSRASQVAEETDCRTCLDASTFFRKVATSALGPTFSPPSQAILVRHRLF